MDTIYCKLIVKSPIRLGMLKFRTRKSVDTIAIKKPPVLFYLVARILILAEQEIRVVDTAIKSYETNLVVCL